MLSMLSTFIIEVMSHSNFLNSSTAAAPKRPRLSSSCTEDVRESADDSSSIIDNQNGKKLAAESTQIDVGKIDDSEADKCPICFCEFVVKEVCVPNCCSHQFCTRCLLEWASKQQTCPIDREHFDGITIRDFPTAPVRGELDLNTGQYIAYVDELDEDEGTSMQLTTDTTVSNISCEVCGDGDRPDRLLLCDDCDRGFHMECLNPPLEEIPDEDWYCPDCLETRSRPLRRSARLQRMQSNRRAVSTRGRRSSPAKRTRAALRSNRRMTR